MTYFDNFILIKIYKFYKFILLFFPVASAKMDPSLKVVFYEDAASLTGVCIALSMVSLSHITGMPTFDRQNLFYLFIFLIYCYFYQKI